MQEKAERERDSLYKTTGERVQGRRGKRRWEGETKQREGKAGQMNGVKQRRMWEGGGCRGSCAERWDENVK